MAISQNFLTGRMRKSAGGTRFSAWRGLNVVASKPMAVRQNVTHAVELNRNKMATIGKMVSKMNSLVKEIYSLGIAKTTPFADTVKFFRSRISDNLRLEAGLLAGASFGTGNAATPDYVPNSLSATSFGISPSNVAGIWGNDDTNVVVIMVNDACTKVGIFEDVVNLKYDFAINPASMGFVAGDKVAFAVKPVKFRPGADLSGKMKFMTTTSFVTLTT